MAEVPVSSAAANFVASSRRVEGVSALKAHPEGESLTPVRDLVLPNGNVIPADLLFKPDLSNGGEYDIRRAQKPRGEYYAMEHDEGQRHHDGGDEFDHPPIQDEDTAIDCPTPPFELH